MARISRFTGVVKHSSTVVETPQRTSRFRGDRKLISTVVEIFENLSGEYTFVDSWFSADSKSFLFEKSLPVDVTSYTDYITFLIEKGVILSDNFSSGYDEVVLDYIKGITDASRQFDQTTFAFSKAANDSFSASDQRLVFFDKATRDFASAADQVGKLFSTLKRDLFGISDAVNLSIAYNRSFQDITNAVDRKAVSFGKPSTSVAILSDFIEILISAGVNLSDMYQLLDGISLDYGKSLRDSSESVDRTSWNLSTVMSNFFVLADLIGKQTDKTLNDNLYFSDLIQIVKQLGREAAEVLLLLDQKFLEVSKAIRDSSQQADNLSKAYNKPVADSLHLSDLIQIVISSGQIYQDIIDYLESVVIAIDKPVGEQLGALDYVEKLYGLSKADFTVVSDLVPTKTVGANKTEPISFADDKSVVFAALKRDINTVWSIPSKNFQKPVSDAYLLSDFIQIVTGIGKPLDDVFLLGESIDTIDVSKVVNEMLQHAEDLAFTVGIVKSEPIGHVDVLTRNYGKTLADQTSKPDQLSKSFGSAKADIQWVSDSLNILRELGKILSHSNNLNDSGTIENQGYVVDNNYFQPGYTGTLTSF